MKAKSLAVAFLAVCVGVGAKSVYDRDLRNLDWFKTETTEQLSLTSPNGEFRIVLQATNDGAHLWMEDRKDGHKGSAHIDLYHDDTKFFLQEDKGGWWIDGRDMWEMGEILRDREKSRKTTGDR